MVGYATGLHEMNGQCDARLPFPAVRVIPLHRHEIILHAWRQGRNVVNNLPSIVSRRSQRNPRLLDCKSDTQQNVTQESLDTEQLLNMTNLPQNRDQNRELHLLEL